MYSTQYFSERTQLNSVIICVTLSNVTVRLYNEVRGIIASKGLPGFRGYRVRISRINTKEVLKIIILCKKLSCPFFCFFYCLVQGKKLVLNSTNVPR